MPARESRIPASSSTMRMLCMLGGGRCRSWFENNGKFHDESRSHRLVFFHADRAVMIRDNAANDRKPQTRAAFLGGEIGKEKFFFECTGDAVAGVGHGNLN